MKLVDILLVLTTAATANAILIPTDNDGSLQASGTSSRVSGPTNEPSSGTSNEYQEEPMDIVDPSTSRRSRKRPIDELGPSISEQDWKAIIDRPDPGIPEDWRDLVDAVNSNILKDQQQSIDQPSPSTPKRGRKRPIDEHGSNISKQDQQQSMNQPGPSASKQSRKQSTDEPGLVFPDKYWQRLIDEVDSDAFKDWKELFDIVDQSTPNQNKQQPMIQSNPSTSSQDQQQPTDIVDPSTYGQNQQYSTDTINSSILDENWRDLFDIADSSTSNQVSGPANEPNPNISDQTQQHPVDAIGLSISNEDWQEIIDAASSTTSNQDQQQPMIHNESTNTVTNQIARLSQKYQITLDGMKKRLVESKVIRDKKRKEYYGSMALGFKQWSALERGEEVSELGYDPDTEIRLKHEYEKAGAKIRSIRQDLKRFMKKHGLRFEEPN
ncbi:hypothetical protein O5D80_004900 [Batrachochytrium dendrobatidis]|nr:hypothetical protein O5D80_004900 [Batrachochytrium dendrobatidis]